MTFRFNITKDHFHLVLRIELTMLVVSHLIHRHTFFLRRMTLSMFMITSEECRSSASHGYQ